MRPNSENQTVPASIGGNAYISTVLASILAISLIGIAIDAYVQTRELMNPKRLGDRVETAIRENYPAMRKELLAEIKTQAPQLAQQASRELIHSTPKLRGELERFAARQLESGLDDATEFSAEQFRKLLQQNRDTVLAAFEQIEEAPEEARRLILESESEIEQTLGIDLQRQARNALRVHRQFNDKLERLNGPNETLDAKEQLERRIVRILRTIQLEHASLASLD